MVNKEMLLMCYLLLLLREGRFTSGHNFVTKTIHVGQNVTLTCPRSHSSKSQIIFWIKFSSGYWPESLGQTITFDYEGITKTRHFTSKQEKGTFVLHIKEAQRNDTGLYYCVKAGDLKLVFMNGTFLMITGSEADVPAVIQEPLPNPVQPGDPVTLQCLVSSDCESRKCPTKHRVYWFRAGPDKSHSRLTDGDGISENECVSRPGEQKCVYSFSKTVSISDAGTYYCAVATAEEIIFGNGTELNVQEQQGFWLSKIPIFLCVAVGACQVVIICLFYIMKKKTYLCNDTTAGRDAQENEEKNAHCLVYAAPTITKSKGGKAERRKTKATHEETVYTQVKDFRIQ